MRQDVLEPLSRHGDLRHLEGHVAPVDDELRADLHELFSQAGQRPVLDAIRQRQRAQEICKIVCERVKLKPDGVGGERAACSKRNTGASGDRSSPRSACSSPHTDAGNRMTRVLPPLPNTVSCPGIVASLTVPPAQAADLGETKAGGVEQQQQHSIARLALEGDQAMDRPLWG